MNDTPMNTRPLPQAAAFLSLGLLASVVMLLPACASSYGEPSAPTTAQMAVGKAAVDRADAAAVADAPMEMAAARQKLALAQTAFTNKDFALARQLAEQAEADAGFAESQARSQRSTRALAEVREGLRQLRIEAARP